MAKQIGLAGIMLLVSSTPCWGMTGFYIGLGGGPEHADFRQVAHIVQGATPTNPSNADVMERGHLAGKGWFGSLFAGYEKRYAVGKTERPNLSLAGEINIDASSVKYKESNDELIHMNYNKASYKMRRSFGVSVLPGVVIQDSTLFYARLGYRGHFPKPLAGRMSTMCPKHN